jgi:aspartyl protease family protein
MSGSLVSWLIYVGVALGLVAMLVGIGIAWHYRASIGWMAATVAVWTIIAGIFITVYIQQMAGTPQEATPPPSSEPQTAAVATPASVEPDASSLRIFPDGNGNYRVQGLVNGATVQFLVDTGATAVLLTPADARRAGIDPDQLQYRQMFKTPNGQVKGADIVIYQLAVGPIRLVNIPGAVVRTDTDISLLGVSFLSRLSGYEVENGAMTLHR